jgi:hypothetical protein
VVAVLEVGNSGCIVHTHQALLVQIWPGVNIEHLLHVLGSVVCNIVL